MKDFLQSCVLIILIIGIVLVQSAILKLIWGIIFGPISLFSAIIIVCLWHYVIIPIITAIMKK